MFAVPPRRDRPLLIVFLACSLAACGTPRAPVDVRGEPAARAPSPSVAPDPDRRTATPGSHTVARGDTLYSIAWRYGIDYREVARWNGIADPYVIYPGQRLRLSAAPGASGTPAAVRPQVADVAPPRPVTAPTAMPRPVAPPATGAMTSGPIRWQWPTRGRIVRSSSPTSKKGIDIAGERGQAVNAAAAGTVVYSGSGLLGYGRLIILKHSDTFLSAYAYNEQLLAAEGDQVMAGRQIATMGTGTSGQPMLHFEIRRDGKPVNPLEHLPRSD